MTSNTRAEFWTEAGDDQVLANAFKQIGKPFYMKPLCTASSCSVASDPPVFGESRQYPVNSCGGGPGTAKSRLDRKVDRAHPLEAEVFEVGCDLCLALKGSLKWRAREGSCLCTSILGRTHLPPGSEHLCQPGVLGRLLGEQWTPKRTNVLWQCP